MHRHPARGLTLGLTLVVAGCSSTGGPAVTGPASTISRPVASVPPTAPTASTRATPEPIGSPAATSPTPAPTFLIYDPSADPTADIDAALAEARTDGRPVLLDFGADWCPDCWILSGYLDSAEGKARIASRAHIVRIDVGGFDRNLDVVKLYGDPIWNGIPAVVALRPDGTIAGTTANGALANAARMTKTEVLEYLGRWVP